jgi:hypothetical protein
MDLRRASTPLHIRTRHVLNQRPQAGEQTRTEPTASHRSLPQCHVKRAVAKKSIHSEMKKRVPAVRCNRNVNESDASHTVSASFPALVRSTPVSARAANNMSTRGCWLHFDLRCCEYSTIYVRYLYCNNPIYELLLQYGGCTTSYVVLLYLQCVPSCGTVHSRSVRYGTSTWYYMYSTYSYCTVCTRTVVRTLQIWTTTCMMMYCLSLTYTLYDSSFFNADGRMNFRLQLALGLSYIVLIIVSI